jgi:O-antigen ligase
LSNLHTYDANDVCVVLLIGLAFVLLLMHVAKGPQRLLLALILFGIGGSIARSGSRGGFVGLIGFAIGALLLTNTVSIVKKGVTLGTIVLALAAFAPPGYWEQMETILSPKEDYNYTDKDGRKAVAERGMSYMMAYPVFGLGIHNFARAECTVSGKRVGDGGVRCTAPHNSYVQAGAELGIPGLIVWTSLIFGGIWAMIGLRRRLPRAWRNGNQVERFLYNSTHYFAVALAGFSASSLFVSFAWLDMVYIMAALMTGLYVSVHAYRARLVEMAGATGGVIAPELLQRPGWRVDRSAWRRASVQTAAHRTGPA